MDLPWGHEEEIITKVVENRNPHYTKWFENFREHGKFNTLYVTSTAVETEHQGKGVGRSLIEDSLDLAALNSLSFRASVLRLPGYIKFHKNGISATEYLNRIKAGEIPNHLINLYMDLGFELGPTIPDYEPDRTSMNYGVFAFKRLGI